MTRESGLTTVFIPALQLTAPTIQMAPATRIFYYSGRSVKLHTYLGLAQNLRVRGAMFISFRRGTKLYGETVLCLRYKMDYVNVKWS
jgi:hypothetical protein